MKWLGSLRDALWGLLGKVEHSEGKLVVMPVFYLLN